VFSYASVVPWGRSYDEYLRMFDLGEADLGRRLLGCGDGPASFNARMARDGHPIVSLDPLYGATRAQIERRIDETYDDVIGQTRREQHRFVWDRIGSVDELGRVRLAAMREFLADYDAGKAAGRYLAGELPRLDFADGAFDLALSSHLLFFYADQLDVDFHEASTLELCRVAGQVRIFPVIDVNGAPSPHLEPVRERLAARGIVSELVTVDYEFQRGGNRMLRLERAA